MTLYRFSLDDSHSKRLEDALEEFRKRFDSDSLEAADYIRFKLFDEAPPAVLGITPEEVARRALEQCVVGQIFSVPELFSDEEWAKLPRGTAGVLGRRFYRYTQDHKFIEFVPDRKRNRQALYRLISKEEL